MAGIRGVHERVLRALKVLAILLAVGSGATVPGVAEAQGTGYTFTKIAETTGVGTYTEFASPVVIDDGRVFFIAETQSGERVLLSGSGGALTTVIDSSLPGLTLFYDTAWSVNNAGTIAFLGEVSGQLNVFTTTLAGLTPINDPTDPDGVDGPAGGAISDSGNVAITDLRRMSLGNGGPLTLLFDAATDVSLPGNHIFLSINANDSVAFVGFTLAGQAVYRVSSGGTLATIGSLPNLTRIGAPQINDSGVVAFYRRTAASGAGTRTIVVGNGGALQTVADNTVVFTEFGSPNINNAGTVAFLALTAFQQGTPSRIGALTGPDLVNNRVLMTGDPLFGATVIGILGDTVTDSLGRVGFNNNGHLAFLATLSDGRRVVVRANPGAPFNRPPLVTNPGNRTVTRGVPITPLQIQATDPDGNPLTYQAAGLPPGVTINPSTGLITGTPGPSSSPPSSPGTWSTTVTVSDGRAATLINFLWTVLPTATATATVQFSTATYTVGEAAGNATITVTRSGSTTSAVTVQYVTSAGTATAGVDYTQRSGTLTIGAGLTSATFSVPIAADALVEGPETVNLTLSIPSGGTTLGVPSSAVLTITDNDVGGAFQFSAATYGVVEPASAATPVVATITVTRAVPAGMTAGLATVDYATSNGTATAGADYTATSGTLTFPVGILSRRFTVPVLHDTVDEPAETVNLTLTNPTGGATLGARSTAVLTIADNDVGGAVRLSAATYTVREGGGQAAITVIRAGGAASGVPVQYATANGTAVAGEHYTTTTGTLTFAAGEATKTFTVPIADNAVADGTRGFTVGLTAAGGGGVLGVPSTATVTIVDDEVGVRFSVAGYTVGEAGVAATITVVRTGPVAPVVTVQYATSDGSATAGADYAARSGTLTFGAGVVTRTFTVPIVNDTVVEGPETVNLTLSTPGGGARLGTPSSAVLTIRDNDVGGAFQFSAAAYGAVEPASAATPVVATITVTRTVPAGMTAGLATVDYATSIGTATAGADYAATSGTLTFPVGILSRRFTVPVLHDTVDEPAETANLTLTNPTGGATLGVRSTAVLRIADND